MINIRVLIPVNIILIHEKNSKPSWHYQGVTIPFEYTINELLDAELHFIKQFV